MIRVQQAAHDIPKKGFPRRLHALSTAARGRLMRLNWFLQPHLGGLIWYSGHDLCPTVGPCIRRVLFPYSPATKCAFLTMCIQFLEEPGALHRQLCGVHWPHSCYTRRASVPGTGWNYRIELHQGPVLCWHAQTLSESLYAKKFSRSKAGSSGVVGQTQHIIAVMCSCKSRHQSTACIWTSLTK